ncbi:hypothetical protein O0L34_g17158 [Tuta absoluta]|nr:hypothetical protein O0L34_g17158 [Tuta absoluta]
MAAQPPRPPPNNLLFCGPPPALPTVVLLPSDLVRDINSLDAAPDPTFTQTSNTDALQDINNVGVPTYDGFYGDHVNKNSELMLEQQLPPDSFLKRTQSFDISDIYAAKRANEFDTSDYRYRRSEPDLSKFGLFLEAEVTVECEHQEPPSLVLNNPFYDGSYAIDPSQINPTMVMMPDNYLAFEDTFVPWKYRPEILMDRDGNSELYYDGVPLIPSNDPWAPYGVENAGYDYYSPQFIAPIGDQDGIHYMPLADFEYAIPQYMSLPTVEQANVETFPDSSCHSEEMSSSHTKETDPQEDTVTSTQTETGASSVRSAISSNVVSEDEKTSVVDSSATNRESSCSDESFNADISNDVTSSLAFMPSSKSSQVPCGADDTSDDTSPCSTDYQEASALDLVQSLDDLSSGTDFSQSRDDASPAFPEPPKPNIVLTNDVESNRNDSHSTYVLESNETLANVPLSKLPSIPIHNKKLLSNLPPVPNSLLEKDSSSNTQSQPPQQTEAVPQTLVNKNEVKENNINNQASENVAPEITSSQSIAKITQPPHPPDVPTAWLAPRPSNCEQAATAPPASITSQSQGSVTQVPPQIQVQSTEIQPSDKERSKQPPPQQPPRTTQPTVEVQPSCSYVPPAQPQPNVQATQLKPIEVEVSFVQYLMHNIWKIPLKEQMLN